jgi:hypothetical protein
MQRLETGSVVGRAKRQVFPAENSFGDTRKIEKSFDHRQVFLGHPFPALRAGRAR